MDEDATVGRARVNQVREVFPLHHTQVFQSSNRVIAQLERLPLNACKPTLKAREIQGILLTRVYQENRARCKALTSLRSDRRSGIKFCDRSLPKADFLGL